MLQKKRWQTIAIVILLIEVVPEAMLIYRLISLGILPGRYTAAAVAGLSAAAVITAVLLFLGMGHGPGRSRQIRRLAGLILAVLAAAGSLFGFFVMNKVGDTVQKITETPVNKAMVGVYVMKEDPAQILTDVRDESFGILKNLDRNNTEAALDGIKNELGSAVSTKNYGTLMELIRALYTRESRVIVMNESFVSALESTESYRDFSSAVRLIFEAPVADNQSSARNGVSDVTKQPFTVYLSGSDTRSKVLDVSRSDVNILMTVNPAAKQILLVNTPRDYYIKNPAGNGAPDKLTHCGIYGVDCSMEALGDLYGTKLNYYGQINFTGFETLIDAVGGVTVESDKAFQADGFSYVKGMNQMNGKEALRFVRERHAFEGGDNVRGKNQMRLISAVVKKISGSGSTVLKNYSEVLQSLQGTFTTDFSSDEISSLARLMISGGGWDVKQYSVTGTGGKAATYSMPDFKAYVMYPDEKSVARATELIRRVKNGERLTDEDVRASAES